LQDNHFPPKSKLAILAKTENYRNEVLSNSNGKSSQKNNNE